MISPIPVRAAWLLTLVLCAGCALVRPPAGSTLDGLHLQRQVSVEGVSDNLSGLAYDRASGHLLAVVNRPALLLVLDRDGHVQRRIALRGFVDTEGVAVLGNGQVAVTEEALNRIAMFRMPPPGADVVDHDQARVIALDLFAHGNSGYEGLAHAAHSDCMWTVKEKSPRGLYSICMHGSREIAITDRSAWLLRARAGSDLSGIAIDPRSGHLLLLSDESRRVTELDMQGRVIGQRALGGPGEAVPPQPEGITLDDDGHLYVVSEPDRFYRFGRD